MTFGKFLLILGSVACASGESATDAIFTNLETAAWTHEKGDPAGSESVMLRTDPVTGGIELLVRFPGGHVIPPHWHEANERLVILEGQVTLRQDNGETKLDSGGYAFLPAREIHRLSCSSKTRCTFYLSLDGKPQSHRAK